MHSIATAPCHNLVLHVQRLGQAIETTSTISMDWNQLITHKTQHFLDIVNVVRGVSDPMNNQH